MWLPVTDASFHRHYKRGDPDAPPSFSVDYLCGLSPYAEYVSFERQGYPRTCAERWWYALGGSRRSRRRWTRRCIAGATRSGGRDRGRAQRPILERHRSPRPAPGRRVVEVDRHHRCWVIETRADAARALAAAPINDVILF